jgi:hypothetical protein
MIHRKVCNYVQLNSLQKSRIFSNSDVRTPNKQTDIEGIEDVNRLCEQTRLVCNPKVRALTRLQDHRKGVLLSTHSLYTKVQKNLDVKQVHNFLPPS